MQEDQFTALLRITGLHAGSATSQGLRLVLMQGLTHQEAAVGAGVARQSITRALKVARERLADAQQLQGVELPAERSY